MAGSNLWVNPEGVRAVGEKYGDVAATFDQYRRLLDTVRATYEGSWGGDEMGQQFAEKFVEGLDSMSAALAGVADNLSYASRGLVESGRSYRQAEDDAEVAGAGLTKSFEAPPTAQPSSPSSPSSSPLDPAYLRPSQVPLPSLAQPAELRPAFHTVQSVKPADPVRPAHLLNAHGPTWRPAASTVQLLASHDGVLLNGSPIPPGYQLLSAHEVEEGVVRLDANLHMSINPIGTDEVLTDPTGAPIVPEEGHQLFLVPDNWPGPDTDPEPHYLEFHADGTIAPSAAR